MKKTFLLVIIVLLTYSTKAQIIDSISKIPNDTITPISKLDSPPDFQGGKDAYFKYLSKNQRYPKSDLKAGNQGVVIVEFTVEKDGSLTDITVLRSFSLESDHETFRLINDSPKWIPGKIGGKPCRSRIRIPIRFTIPE